MGGKTRAKGQKSARLHIFLERGDRRQALPQRKIRDRPCVLQRHAVPTGGKAVGSFFRNIGKRALQRPAIADLHRAKLHTHRPGRSLDLAHAGLVA